MGTKHIDGSLTINNKLVEIMPQRVSLAYNLVVNINQEQYRAGYANWSGDNSSAIRQFRISSSVAGMEDIKALLSHLTGSENYDVYNATKPTPCFVFCTQSNTWWKLQYDGDVDGLRAYKVVNFPFALKSEIPTSTIESYTITTWTSDNNIAPFTYKANVSATATIGQNTIVELINDNAILFATYGFAIGAINSQTITIYSIGEPTSNVTLSVKIGG